MGARTESSTPQAPPAWIESERPRIEALEAAIRYRFRHSELAVEALVHPSFAAEHRPTVPHYQRLELLGDAAVGLIVARELWTLMERAPEGVLSRTRAEVVGTASLAAVARTTGLGDLVLLGRGEHLRGGREKEAILADVLESVVGAVLADGGYARASAVVSRLLKARIAVCVAGAAGNTDAKSALQELTQATSGRRPEYRLVATRGPAHEPLFEIACLIEGHEVARGEGRTKQAAQQAAAGRALASLRAQA